MTKKKNADPRRIRTQLHPDTGGLLNQIRYRDFFEQDHRVMIAYTYMGVIYISNSGRWSQRRRTISHALFISYYQAPLQFITDVFNILFGSNKEQNFYRRSSRSSSFRTPVLLKYYKRLFITRTPNECVIHILIQLLPSGCCFVGLTMLTLTCRGCILQEMNTKTHLWIWLPDSLINS